MSTANNISEKDIIAYLTCTLQYWGITYVSEEDFKKARKGNPSAVKPLKKLVFHLSLLHMFDYNIRVDEILNPQQIKQAQMQEVLLAYLSETQCPYLLEMQGDGVDQYVGCNLQSSRVLLLIAGWIMAVSDYFNQITQKAIVHLQNKIQRGPTMMTMKVAQNIVNCGRGKAQSHLNLSKNPQQNSPKQKLICQLYKSIEVRMYRVECLQKKKSKTINKIQEKLKQYNEKLSINDLFALNNSKDDNQRLKLQKQLKMILTNQIQGMKQRKYFWTWLQVKIYQKNMQQKVLKDAIDTLKATNENYSSSNSFGSDKVHNTTTTIQVDLQYLQKYFQLCTYYQEKFAVIEQRLEQMKLPLKRSRQIFNQVQDDIKNTLESSKVKYQNNKKHLFIALQLRDQLGLGLKGKGKLSNDNNDVKKNIEEKQRGYEGNVNFGENSESKAIKKQLKRQLKNYLQDIEESLRFL